jgi:sugar O-acyltransferase (sialic acid O-acetyltransferase NeuD family)
MKKADLVLIGAGGHSGSCIDVIEQEGRFRIAGLVDIEHKVGSSHFGYEVLSTDEGLEELGKSFQYALVTLGQILSYKTRSHLYRQAMKVGFELVTVIAPSAYVSPRATIGAGTIVMHGAIINAGAVVGNNCIINSRALLEHNSCVSDHCHISTGAVLNGDSSIGTGSFIGSGTIVKEGVSVGSASLVGMGLALRHNLNSNSKYLGGNDY